MPALYTSFICCDISTCSHSPFYEASPLHSVFFMPCKCRTVLRIVFKLMKLLAIMGCRMLAGMCSGATAALVCKCCFPPPPPPPPPHTHTIAILSLSSSFDYCCFIAPARTLAEEPTHRYKIIIKTTRSRSPALTYTNSCSHTHALTHTHSCSHTHALTYTHSCSHTHALTYSCVRSHAHTHIRWLKVCLSACWLHAGCTLASECVCTCHLQATQLSWLKTRQQGQTKSSGYQYKGCVMQCRLFPLRRSGGSRT